MHKSGANLQLSDYANPIQTTSPGFSGRNFSGMGDCKKFYGRRVNCSGTDNRIFCPKIEFSDGKLKQKGFFKSVRIFPLLPVLLWDEVAVYKHDEIPDDREEEPGDEEGGGEVEEDPAPAQVDHGCEKVLEVSKKKKKKDPQTTT